MAQQLVVSILRRRRDLAQDSGDAAESDARSFNAVRIWRQILTTLHIKSEAISCNNRLRRRRWGM
jgi:hypothetical protein